jgi:cell division protein FtsQ
MLKRINWKLVFKTFAWLLCLSGTVVLMGFIDKKQQSVKCTNIGILIPGANNFIEREEINAILKSSQGDIIGRNLEGVNLHEIEKSIGANPYIAFVKVYAEMNGSVYVEVRQRQPVLRIINQAGQDYYVDSEGLKVPVSSNFTADVIVASGKIMEPFNGRLDTLSTSLGKDLYKMALFFSANKLWDAQIEQLFVNDKSQVELVPRVGNQHILLGDASNLPTKMENLATFYKEVMPHVGWNVYKEINLMYKDQIVAVKNSDTVEKNKPINSVLLDSLQQTKVSVDSAIKTSIKEAAVPPENKATKEKPKELSKKANLESDKVKTPQKR